MRTNKERENNKVSIIIPVYNAEHYLVSCVESVLKQRWTEFEVLLVDDGSTDNSLFLCKTLASQDKRIQVFHQENKGVSAARNVGIGAATGKYLLFLDADDLWDPNYIEQMVISISKSDLAICKEIRFSVDGVGKSIIDYTCDMTSWCWPILNHYSVSCNECIFHRALVEEMQLRFTIGRKSGEDQEFTDKYMLHCQRIVYNPEAIYYYRINPASAMFQKNYNHFDAVEAIKAVEKYAAFKLPTPKFHLIRDTFTGFKYPYLLEFAVLTLLTAGEKPRIIMEYLHGKGYDKLLDNAFQTKQHWDSCFMRLWKLNPLVCLQYFKIRRIAGRIMRKVRLRK